MTRLSNATLGGLSADVARPTYDRAALKTGIVHLGIGAFHRAQEAVFTEAAIAAGGLDWGICGASLRSAETRDALVPQDGLYTVAVRGPAGEQLQVIGAVKTVLVGAEDPGALIAAMTDPRVRIVSLTVTEKGYCHDPATGRLNATHPDIVHDIANPQKPRSAPGYLVEALRRRRADGTAPFTVLCCDNLPHNGATVAGIVRDLAELHDKDLARFVAAEVAFPSTMVDRIVPATTDADRTAITGRLGVDDAWPIVTEPYNYWAVEDRFPAGRPDWPGVEFVTDIAPYEAMKLRLLNASHSVMAYLGYLAGHETIADTIADPVFLRLVEGLMDVEVTPTLKLPAGTDVAAYKRALVERFANAALKHRTWQIAMDGSQKLPQRLLGTVRDRLAANAPIDRLALGVAGWMRYVTGSDERGQPIDVRDPLADRLRTIAGNAGPNAARLAPMFLEVREVFGELAADTRFRDAVTAALTQVLEKGARGATTSLAS
jgi:fructuronate reductase